MEQSAGKRDRINIVLVVPTLDWISLATGVSRHWRMRFTIASAVTELSCGRRAGTQ